MYLHSVNYHISRKLEGISFPLYVNDKDFL